MNLTEDQKTKMRAFLQEQGRAVQFTGARDATTSRSRRTAGTTTTPGSTSASAPAPSGRTYFGDGCSWVVEPGVVLREVVYSMFTDTFHDNENEVGVECSPVRCACGKYTDVTLRWVGSLGELMHAIFGPDVPKTGVTL